jgi:hypothetical protein
MVMGNTIKWETSFDSAISKAKAENKHVLIDFFNPG